MYAFSLAFFAAVSFPQEPTAALDGPQRAPAPTLAAVLADRRTTLFDRPEPGGPWWTRGSNFKASFGANGWTFVPQPPAGATALEPIGFRLASVSFGGTKIVLGDVEPQRTGQRLAYDHGVVAETLDVDGDGIEQQFVLPALPAAGEVRLDLDVTTEVPATTEAGRIVFASAGGAVTYSNAIAIDAAGRRIAAPTTLDGSRLTIRVPAAFVAIAALPLVVDPRIAFAVPGSGNSDFADPDVTGSRYHTFLQGWRLAWVATYANWFGATDWDCYVQVYDADLVPLAGPFVIDLSTDGWMRPRIANIHTEMVIVAEVRSGSSPHRIRGRPASTNPSGPSLSLGAPFAISFDTVDCLNPDVGGTTGTWFPFIPGYFTVVWERAFSATDHDIYARQVDVFGQLRPGPVAIQADSAHQTHPAISKSCGNFPAAGGPSTPNLARHAIVWEQSAGSSNHDIHGALLSWDGWQIAVNGSYTFPIDTSLHDDVRPSVSGPSVGDAGPDRLLLAAYERTSSNNGDIAATCLRGDGTILAQGNVSVLENDATRLAWPQRRPSVDCDGYRFGVAYHELYQGTAADLDTRMSVVALAGTQLAVLERAAILGFSSNREFNVEVASEFGANSAAGGRYCTTNDRDNTNNTFAIDVRTFTAAPADAFATRTTACGTTMLVAGGHTVLGTSATFTATLPGEFVVVMIGTPAATPLPGCSCVLGVADPVAYASPTTVQIPLQITLIGVQLAAQGLALTFATPNCFGYLQLSDTIDFTVQ